MTKLVLGRETIGIRTAKSRVLKNIKSLNDRIQALHASPDIGKKIHAFYAKKVEEQKAILQWLDQYGKGNHQN